jgi:hypothetical protein
VIPISVSAGTVMAVFLMAVIVLGYVVIWAIWHFFFRDAGDHVPGERPATVPRKPHDARIREPLSPADRSCGGSAPPEPRATQRAAQAPGPAIGAGEAPTASRAGNDAPADASDVLREARHSASSSEGGRET